MGDKKSSGTLPAVCLSVELQLPAGQVMELPGPKLGDEFWPLLDCHLVNAEGASDSGLSLEVPDGVSFEHQPNITMLYPEFNTALPVESHTNEMESMGDRIRMLRHSKGWTQQQLGDRLGVSKVAVYQWEVGTTSDIKLKTFLKLVEELGTNPQYLLFGHEAPRTPSRKRSQT